MKDRHPTSLGVEIRIISSRSARGLADGSGAYKQALGAAALVMAVTSVCNTAMPLLLGRLVDQIKRGTETGASRQNLYTTAAWILGMIGIAYLLREGLNVFAAIWWKTHARAFIATCA